mmetsp:Transcript_20613/g.56887  ORF Transcript_20613/g.56887 Transcript_20613/m.56887 type:complete len:135 (+) Transcript_20613:153-557(+)
MRCVCVGGRGWKWWDVFGWERGGSTFKPDVVPSAASRRERDRCQLQRARIFEDNCKSDYTIVLPAVGYFPSLIDSRFQILETDKMLCPERDSCPHFLKQTVSPVATGHAQESSYRHHLLELPTSPAVTEHAPRC